MLVVMSELKPRSGSDSNTPPVAVNLDFTGAAGAGKGPPGHHGDTSLRSVTADPGRCQARERRHQPALPTGAFSGVTRDVPAQGFISDCLEPPARVAEEAAAPGPGRVTSSMETLLLILTILNGGFLLLWGWVGGWG